MSFHPPHGCCTQHIPDLITVSCSSEKKYVALAYHRKFIRIFDAETNQQVGSDLTGHQEAITSMQFSPDNQMIVTGGFDSTRVWDLNTGQQIGNYFIRNEQLSFKVVCFSPNGLFIACGGFKISNIIWNIYNQSDPFKCLTICQIGSMDYSPDGRLLLSNEGYIWQTTNYRFQKIIHKSKFDLVKVSPNSKSFASAGHGRLNISDLRTGKQINRFNGIRTNVEVLSYSKGGNFLISNSESRQILVWNLSTRTKECVQNQTLSAHSIYFTPDDDKFIVITSEYKIIIHQGSIDQI